MRVREFYRSRLHLQYHNRSGESDPVSSPGGQHGPRARGSRSRNLALARIARPQRARLFGTSRMQSAVMWVRLLVSECNLQPPRHRAPNCVRRGNEGGAGSLRVGGTAGTELDARSCSSGGASKCLRRRRYEKRRSAANA